MRVLGQQYVYDFSDDFSRQVLFWPTDEGVLISAQASHFKAMHIQQQPTKACARVGVKQSELHEIFSA